MTNQERDGLYWSLSALFNLKSSILNVPLANWYTDNLTCPQIDSDCKAILI